MFLILLICVVFLPLIGKTYSTCSDEDGGSSLWLRMITIGKNFEFLEKLSLNILTNSALLFASCCRLQLLIPFLSYTIYIKKNSLKIIIYTASLLQLFYYCFILKQSPFDRMIVSLYMESLSSSSSIAWRFFLQQSAFCSLQYITPFTFNFSHIQASKCIIFFKLFFFFRRENGRIFYFFVLRKMKTK